MDYLYILPSIEVLVFNLFTLNHCFKRKYSIFKTVVVFCAFTILFILPWVFLKDGVFQGDGRFSILGFLYIKDRDEYKFIERFIPSFKKFQEE